MRKLYSNSDSRYPGLENVLAREIEELGEMITDIEKPRQKYDSWCGKSHVEGSL